MSSNPYNPYNKASSQLLSPNKQKQQQYQQTFKSDIYLNNKPKSTTSFDNKAIDLFKGKLKQNYEFSKVREQSQQMRQQRQQFENNAEYWRNKYRQLQKQNQTLKKRIQELQRNQDSQRRNQLITASAYKNETKKSKLTLAKSYSPPKSYQNNDSEALLQRAVEYLKKQSKSPADFKKYYQYAEDDLLKVLNQIQSIKQKDTPYFQKLAYVYTNLVKAKCGLQRPIPQIEELSKKALNIYNSKEGVYFQQKIVMLNEMGQHYQKLKDLNSALEVYKQIEKIQAKYYSKNDERKILILNNIACFYCNNKMLKEGLSCFKISKELAKGTSLEKTVQANINYYQLKIGETLNLPYKGEKFNRWLTKSPKKRD